MSRLDYAAQWGDDERCERDAMCDCCGYARCPHGEIQDRCDDCEADLCETADNGVLARVRLGLESRGLHIKARLCAKGFDVRIMRGDEAIGEAEHVSMEVAIGTAYLAAKGRPLVEVAS